MLVGDFNNIIPFTKDEVRQYISGLENCIESDKNHGLTNLEIVLLKTIEALQQENEQLRAKLEDWKHEVQCHMDEVIAREKQIEQLRVRVARMREALESIKRLDKTEYTYYGARARNKNGELPPDGERWKTPMEIAMGVLSTDIDQDYHNPADVAALEKVREALEQTKGFIKGIGCYCNYEGEYASQCQPCFIVEQIDKALAEIDKVIGG